MNLYKRGPTWYVKVQVNGQVTRRSTGTGNKADAVIIGRNLERELRIKASTGASIAAKEPRVQGRTLEAAFSRALRTHYRDHKDVKKTGHNMAQVIRLVGDNVLSAIDYDWSERLFQKVIDSGSSPARYNRLWAVTRKTLVLACEQWGWIKAVPSGYRARESSGRINYYSQEQEAALLMAARDLAAETDSRHRADDLLQLTDLMVFLVETGCRLGEALRATPGDIQNGRLVIPESKNGSPRSVPLTARAQRVVADRPELFNLGDDRAEKLFAAVRQRAATEGVLHTYRHTCATRLAAAGVPVQHIQLWMGHKNIATTMRYMHLDSSHLGTALELLEGTSA